MSGRHRWGARRPVSRHKTERDCIRPGCGVIKVTWHLENEIGRVSHSREFWHDGVMIAGADDPTPPCQPQSGRAG